MVRYADDTCLGFEHREEAERSLAEHREWVAQLWVSLPPDETLPIAFGRYANSRRDSVLHHWMSRSERFAKSARKT